VQTPPASVTLTFTEAPDLKLSSVEVVDSTGADVSAGETTAVEGDPLSLRRRLGSNLPTGTYTVSWRTVSVVDGHVTAGSFAFGVGVAPAPGRGGARQGTSSSAFPAAGAVAARWLLYAGLAIVLGGAVAWVLVLRRELPAGGRLALVIGWSAAAAGAAASVVVEQRAVGASLGGLLGFDAGRNLLLEAAFVALTGLPVALAVARRSAMAAVIAGAGALIALWFHALGGHAAASSPLRWGNVLTQTIHLAAVAVWIGGLVWLLLGLRGAPSAARRDIGTRFSAVATIALAAVVVTGLLRAVSEIGSFGDLFDTTFGITLIVKSSIVALLLGLGALNRFRNVPGLSRGARAESALRTTVRAEVAVAATVFVAAAVLSGLPPSRYVAQASGRTRPTSLTVGGADYATSVRVKLGVTPGTAGSNLFTARIVDYDTRRPVRARSVDLRFSYQGRAEMGASTLALRRRAAGIWTAEGTNLSILGRWDVDVVIVTARSSTEVRLQVSPRLPPERVEVARAAGQPTIYTASLPGGLELQGYVDPGRKGRNTVHFTFFRPSGKEQPISRAHASALDPGGGLRRLRLLRFDRGHFVANASLKPGRWTFLVTASTTGGASVSGYFAEPIPTSTRRGDGG
jgi:copper transport protein